MTKEKEPIQSYKVVYFNYNLNKYKDIAALSVPPRQSRQFFAEEIYWTAFAAVDESA